MIEHIIHHWCRLSIQLKVLCLTCWSISVFLGGSCNPTTWRHDVAIPFLKQHGITFYNPVRITQMLFIRFWLPPPPHFQAVTALHVTLCIRGGVRQWHVYFQAGTIAQCCQPLSRPCCVMLWNILFMAPRIKMIVKFKLNLEPDFETNADAHKHAILVVPDRLCVPVPLSVLDRPH